MSFALDYSEMKEYINTSCDNQLNSLSGDDDYSHIEYARSQFLKALDHCHVRSQVINLKRFFNRIYLDNKTFYSPIEILEEGVDVTDLLDEVESQPGMWFVDQRRQKNIDLHKDTQCIPLIVGIPLEDRPWPYNMSDSPNDKEGVLYKNFPLIIQWLNSYCLKNRLILGRTAIVKLFGKSSIGKHSDVGLYHHNKFRYHFCLSGQYDYHVADEMCMMKAGTIMRFNNKFPHWAINHDDSPRVTIIFDAQPYQ
jgi:hypothetical protein